MSNPARWLLPEPVPPAARGLAEKLSLTFPVTRVLWRRGLRDPGEARKFLYPNLDDLHDPLMLRDMDKATERLAQAVHTRERILLYGDYDVDGSTSVIILKTAIELAGGQASIHIPDRFGEGYGMQADVIEKAAANHVSLVISADTGIRATGPVERASELGLDVIITDHHLPEETLPPALAVVNPNRADCPYPNKSLCGAGVAFKLIQSLYRALDWPERKARSLFLSLLKMVSIATVADVVPLTGENRVIVRYGLDGLRVVRNPGLRALLDAAGFQNGERPTAGQVAFRIAPRINAAGRMAHASKVVDLFLTDDPAHARAMAATLHDWNQERQQTEAAILREILETCERHPVADDQAALVFEGEGWHRGVVGIVATRIVERYHRPVFVLSVDRETGEAQGSGRSISAFHLLESLESMAELFLRFGGHQQAAGLSLRTDRIAEFRRRLNAYAAERLGAEDLRPVCRIDATIDFDEISDQSAADILSLEPFGYGNPTPVFAAEGVEVAGPPSVFKQKHLRLPVRRDGRCFWFKGWHFAARIGELAPGSRIDVAFSFEKDSYAAARGRPGWGLVLRDVRQSRR